MPRSSVAAMLALILSPLVLIVAAQDKLPSDCQVQRDNCNNYKPSRPKAEGEL